MITLADIAKYDYVARETLVIQNLVNDCFNIICRYKNGISSNILLKVLREEENTRPDDSKHYAQMEDLWNIWIEEVCLILEKMGRIERIHTGLTVYKPL